MDDIVIMLLKRCTISVLALLWLPLLVQAQNLQLADSLSSIGSKYEERGNYEEAEFYLSEAIKIYQKYEVQDTTRYAEVLFDYVESLYQRAKYDEALSQLDVIDRLVEDGEEESLLTYVHNYRGLILKYQSHYSEAQQQYEMALELATQHRDSLMIAIVNDNLGAINHDLGEYSESLEHRRRALSLFQKVGTDLNQAITLNNIGLTYLDLSMYHQGYQYFSKSLSISKTLNNSARLLTVYINIGMAQVNLGNYDQAMISYQKALEYSRETGNPVKEADLLSNLGNLYNRLGDKQKSLEYYQRSLQVVLDHNITSPTELSTKYKNIATRQIELGQLEKASQNFRKALNLRKKTGNIREIALSYLDIAQVERQRNRFDRAYEYAIRGKKIADSTQIGTLVVEAEIELGQIQKWKGSTKQAIPHFRKAYRQSMSVSDRMSHAPLALLAYTFDEMKSDSAVVYGQKLVEKIEQNRSKVGELASLKSSYFENYSDFYENLASWMIKYQSDNEQAFEMVESSKARALLDELVQASQNLDEMLPLEKRLKKQQLQEAIENCQSWIDTTTANPVQRQQLQNKLRDAELEYAAFMNELRVQNPDYKKLEYPSPVSAREAQALTSANTAILEYAFSKDELLIFLITQEQIQVKRVDVAEGNNDSQKITTLVEQFRDNILAHQPEEQIQAQSSGLVHKLIDPFYDELSNYKNIMIVPDGVLAYLPFEALTVQGRYLVEQFNVKYAPSMTTFSLLKDSKKHHKAHSRDLLAVAGSNFGGTSSPISRGKALPPLPATLAEVDSIASKFTDAEVFKEGSFSEQFIKDNLTKNYRYVHLATHGIIDEDYPNLSGLALSSPPEEASGSEDGMLRSSEIYQLNINSDMVVLSACNTGLGKIVNGEGMLGLQRSFFYAGVPTVSVSLWNVYDRSTAYFMDQFYSSLLNTADQEDSGWGWNSLLRWVGWDQSVPFGNAARAMRHAKLNMLEHPLYHHPVYWAPFIILGR